MFNFAGLFVPNSGQALPTSPEFGRIPVEFG